LKFNIFRQLKKALVSGIGTGPAALYVMYPKVIKGFRVQGSGFKGSGVAFLLLTFSNLEP
jgi:hypothetical protein